MVYLSIIIFIFRKIIITSPYYFIFTVCTKHENWFIYYIIVFYIFITLHLIVLIIENKQLVK